MSANLRRTPDFEQSITQTGWGLYHYFMIGMASACAFSQAMAFISIPFAVPLAVCDFSQSQSNSRITTVNLYFSLGMAFGGYILTSISDIIGRKSMTSVTLLLIFGGTFACGFSHDTDMVITCIFILGCGMASNANCVKIHLAEILPAEKRGSCLVFPDLIWSIGYLFSAMVAWLLTPSIIENQRRDMRLASWRLMFGLSGAFSIMVACATALLRSSPRFLLFSKKSPEAFVTLKHIYAVNNSKHCESYSVDSYEQLHQENLEGCIDDFGLSTLDESLLCIQQLIFMIKRTYKLTTQLMRKRFVLMTVLLAATKFAMISGILIINIWLAKMLEYSDKDDCYITGVDILNLENSSDKCKFSVSSRVYRNFFLVGLNIVMGHLVSFLLIDRLGRRILTQAFLVCGCIACGASSFALGYIHKIYLVQLAISSVFMMAYSLVDSVLDVVVIEVYPTAFRGTAAGSTQFLATFVGGFIKEYLQTPCQYSFIFVGALMLASAMLCYFLPEFRKQAMVE